MTVNVCQRAVKPVLLCLTLVLGGLTVVSASAKPAPPALDERGQELAERYERMQEALREDLARSLPGVDERAKAEYLQAMADEAAAKSAVAEVEKALAEIGGARGLIGHARNHWIPKADRGIAAAERQLAAATTQAERDAAQAELAKWQENRAAGVAALEERTANYERLQAREPELRTTLERERATLEQAKAEVAEAVDALGLDRVLTSDRHDEKLAKYVVLSEATPRGLAAYAQQDGEQRATVERLLTDGELLIDMVLAGGAEDGNYGRAAEIYRVIQQAYPRSREGVLRELALAIALEHATPVSQQNPEAVTDAPSHIDPVARYAHYEEAYLNEELDPYFAQHDAWELRFVVDGNEPNETLAWGREMLRNFRPDHITTTDDRWRYVALVRTDIRYGSEENKFDQPELQFFQNILMNGGICGRRAFIGRFILRAFGVPTVAKPQKGHAALARWTPEGWVPCLGAGWDTGWAPKREMEARDFLELTQARDLGEAYMRVARAHWIGTVMGEERRVGLRTGRGEPGFWNGVALNTQRQLLEASDAQALGAVGEELGEANESNVSYPFESAEISDEERQVSVDRNGVITIPAAATTQPTRSTGKVLFMPSALGGQQLHYSRTGGDQDFSYTFNAPRAGTYHLTMRVVTPAWKQKLHLKVNGANQPIEIELPHTVGLWETTAPIEVELVEGENTLTFSRRGVQQEVQPKGFTIRDYTLTPR